MFQCWNIVFDDMYSMLYFENKIQIVYWSIFIELLNYGRQIQWYLRILWDNNIQVVEVFANSMLGIDHNCDFLKYDFVLIWF